MKHNRKGSNTVDNKRLGLVHAKAAKGGKHRPAYKPEARYANALQDIINQGFDYVPDSKSTEDGAGHGSNAFDLRDPEEMTWARRRSVELNPHISTHHFITKN